MVTGQPVHRPLIRLLYVRGCPPYAGALVLVERVLGKLGTDAEVCAQQPFFASAQAASRRLADHPQGRLIPVRSFHAEARQLVDRLEATPSATPTT
jgi:hypothetical protein